MTNGVRLSGGLGDISWVKRLLAEAEGQNMGGKPFVPIWRRMWDRCWKGKSPTGSTPVYKFKLPKSPFFHATDKTIQNPTQSPPQEAFGAISS